MPTILETWFDEVLISTDPARLDLDAICDMLSRAYWAGGRTRAMVARSLENSLVFGVYLAGRQIGMGRVISDFTIFAYLCDVFILEEYRGMGISKKLMQTILAHPDLQGLRKMMLTTMDAHGLYAQFGFEPLANAEIMMEKRYV
jgi:GNAT superfamily N-acetyltransferase